MSVTGGWGGVDERDSGGGGRGVDERDGGVELMSVTVGMTMMKQMMFVVTDRCE